ncbi:MAG: HxsD-like protein [bacterium]
MSDRITFDRTLYWLEAVEAAAAAYAEHARIELTSTPDTVVAVISDVLEYEPQLVANAFSNHVLHETIARRRQATLDEAG